MRWMFPLAVVVVVSSCAPVKENAKPAEPARVAEVREELLKIPEVPSPVEAPVQGTRATSLNISGITFEGVSFDSRSHRLAVIDQEQGPGTRFADAESAARSCGALASVNGGFFTPEGKPLGLVISGGKSSGGWNSTTSLGSGVWCADFNGQSSIRRRESIGKSGAGGMKELLQAGPMLVENGRRVSGLESEKTSARTVIAWDGGTRWWIGRTPPCSLADLAEALANGQPAGWPVRCALNLDGGRSADLWISPALDGGPVSRRPLWNRPVRNFVVLVPR